MPYELIFIANPDLSDQDVAALNKKVKNFIIEKEGQIKNEKISPKKQLAYPIKKYNAGYYITMDFEIVPGKIKDLTEQIKSENEILRSLTIYKKEEKLKPAKPVLAKKAPPKKEKVKLEDLEKKLEEILEE